MKTHLTLDDIKKIVARIEETFNQSGPGETYVLFDPDEAEERVGWCEEVFMTNIDNQAMLIHYDTHGDWTKAVLIPAENFPNGEDWADQYSPADEAIECFID